MLSAPLAATRPHPQPTEIGNMKALLTIRVHVNELEGSLPTQLGRLPELTMVEMSDNDIEGRFYQRLKRFFLDGSQNVETK